jgi:hypothetical protein
MAVAVGALGAMLIVASPATAAAPNYILVSGPRLSRPVVLANWTQNQALLLAIANAPRAKASLVRNLARRPRFDLAEFWAWGNRPRPTRPNQANQHGWFYPAHGAQPALFDVMVDGTKTPRLAPTQALAILARHDIPQRL